MADARDVQDMTQFLPGRAGSVSCSVPAVLSTSLGTLAAPQPQEVAAEMQKPQPQPSQRESSEQNSLFWCFAVSSPRKTLGFGGDAAVGGPPRAGDTSWSPGCGWVGEGTAGTAPAAHGDTAGLSCPSGSPLCSCSDTGGTAQLLPQDRSLTRPTWLL